MSNSETNNERYWGIYPSTVCPMDEDGRVDAEALEKHVATVWSAGGLKGLLVNGHAGENALLDRAETREVVAVARAAAREALLVAGINSESTEQAVRLAQDAVAESADAVLVFAPYSWALGVDGEAVMHHHQAIHDAVDVPVMLFQGSVRAARLAYPPELIERLIQLRRVVAIKEGSWETAAYEDCRNIVKRLRPEVAVMASGDEHLMPCFALGSEGSIVSLAAVVPEMISALDEAVRARDFEIALALHRRIYPLSKAIYGTGPGGLVAARLKTCLMLLGRLDNPACKRPAQPLGQGEIARLAQALVEAGLEPRAAEGRPRIHAV